MTMEIFLVLITIHQFVDIPGSRGSPLGIIQLYGIILNCTSNWPIIHAPMVDVADNSTKGGLVIYKADNPCTTFYTPCAKLPLAACCGTTLQLSIADEK